MAGEWIFQRGYGNMKWVSKLIMRIYDSQRLKNNDIDYLIEDEKEAIQGYRDKMSLTEDKQIIEIFNSIIKEEQEHIKKLEELRGKL